MYKRGKIWWVTYTLPDGSYKCELSHSTNRRLAHKLADIRRAEVAEGRLALPRSNPPSLESWSERFHESIQNPSTKSRYMSSIRASSTSTRPDSRSRPGLNIARLSLRSQAQHESQDLTTRSCAASADSWPSDLVAEATEGAAFHYNFTTVGPFASRLGSARSV